MHLTSSSLPLNITGSHFTLFSQTMMSSTLQTHTHNKSEGDREFSFWGSPNTMSCGKDDCAQLGSNETRLQRALVSDNSRGKAIAEGRKELMEMMQDIPESNYELSFQDMVVQQQHVPQPEPEPEPNQNETLSNDTLMKNSSTEAQKTKHKKEKKKKKKNKSNRQSQILRVESMDSETFLLKMFFPSSLDWMKKRKVQNGSKVSPKPSLQESMKQKDKEWRIKRFFSTEDCVRQNSGSNSCSNDHSRNVDRNLSFSSGCWPFFQYIKSKTNKLGGRFA